MNYIEATRPASVNLCVDYLWLALFAEEKDPAGKHCKQEVRRPRREPCGHESRMPERGGQASRQPVAESDQNRESEAAPQAQMARQWIEAQRNSECGHDQTRQWHRIFEIAVDQVATRIKSLAL